MTICVRCVTLQEQCLYFCEIQRYGKRRQEIRKDLKFREMKTNTTSKSIL